ncbi:hypothetical protein [Azospirillum himalayense]|uniref:Histidine kinase n=1 Tax=Azospirillum himalayense TaxID=654847 RepID=A0ABW0GCK9_9PROT
MPVLHFPDQGTRRPAEVVIDTRRLTMRSAAEWQQQIVTECRRQRTLTPTVFRFLKGSGLLGRCTFLASEGPAEPLRFCYIGAPTVGVLGRGWARSVLDQPVDQDPHTEFACRVGLEYAEAIGAGEALFNRIAVAGVGRPFVYTQALFGWDDRGRRAVLSAIDM